MTESSGDSHLHVGSEDVIGPLPGSPGASSPSSLASGDISRPQQISANPRGMHSMKKSEAPSPVPLSVLLGGSGHSMTAASASSASSSSSSSRVARSVAAAGGGVSAPTSSSVSPSTVTKPESTLVLESRFKKSGKDSSPSPGTTAAEHRVDESTARSIRRKSVTGRSDAWWDSSNPLDLMAYKKHKRKISLHLSDFLEHRITQEEMVSQKVVPNTTYFDKDWTDFRVEWTGKRGRMSKAPATSDDGRPLSSSAARASGEAGGFSPSSSTVVSDALTNHSGSSSIMSPSRKEEAIESSPLSSSTATGLATGMEIKKPDTSISRAEVKERIKLQNIESAKAAQLKAASATRSGLGSGHRDSEDDDDESSDDSSVRRRRRRERWGIQPPSKKTRESEQLEEFLSVRPLLAQLQQKNIVYGESKEDFERMKEDRRQRLDSELSKERRSEPADLERRGIVPEGAFDDPEEAVDRRTRQRRGTVHALEKSLSESRGRRNERRQERERMERDRSGEDELVSPPPPPPSSSSSSVKKRTKGDRPGTKHVSLSVKKGSSSRRERSVERGAKKEDSLAVSRGLVRKRLNRSLDPRRRPTIEDVVDRGFAPDYAFSRDFIRPAEFESHKRRRTIVLQEKLAKMLRDRPVPDELPNTITSVESKIRVLSEDQQRLTHADGVYFSKQMTKVKREHDKTIAQLKKEHYQMLLEQKDEIKEMEHNHAASELRLRDEIERLKRENSALRREFSTVGAMTTSKTNEEEKALQSRRLVILRMVQGFVRNISEITLSVSDSAAADAMRDDLDSSMVVSGDSLASSSGSKMTRRVGAPRTKAEQARREAELVEKVSPVLRRGKRVLRKFGDSQSEIQNLEDFFNEISRVIIGDVKLIVKEYHICREELQRMKMAHKLLKSQLSDMRKKHGKDLREMHEKSQSLSPSESTVPRRERKLFEEMAEMKREYEKKLERQREQIDELRQLTEEVMHSSHHSSHGYSADGKTAGVSGEGEMTESSESMLQSTRSEPASTLALESQSKSKSRSMKRTGRRDREDEQPAMEMHEEEEDPRNEEAAKKEDESEEDDSYFGMTEGLVWKVKYAKLLVSKKQLEDLVVQLTSVIESLCQRG